MHRYLKISLISFAVASFVGFLSMLGLGFFIYYQVSHGDDSLLKKSTILARINQETTIYYLDGKTPIGSFFESDHRRYINIEEIPDHMINAIVASEDKNFFEHKGVDFTALVIAFWEGIKQGGHFKRGGSSITQQTVKNLLDRRERTFTRKFKEIIAAFQLERQYTKKEILEFYLNQFHVAGNGKGIGVAARYYFNKEVKDLDLIESAFIAGSVKAPSHYNPFTRYSKKDRDRSLKIANARKNYVIRRMYEQGWIKEEEFKEAYATSIPFIRGKFRTEDVALVDLIRNQVSRKEILEALGIDSLQELNQSGFRVYTTIDERMQNSAQLAMRRNLSRLEIILKGFKAEDPEQFKQLNFLEVNDFYYGKVVDIQQNNGKPFLRLNFGLPNATVPYESLERYAKLLDLPTGLGFQHHLKEILSKIKVGDVLFVECFEYDTKTHEGIVELRKRPVINGGLIALDQGEVRAVVSGFDTQGYNRAVFAKRQPGSVFKSLVYYAALQLGWSILDKIDNERQMFPYQGRFYYPRPDHPSPFPETSMIWAGTMSENLASVSLARHLVDKLPLEQFKELMSVLDLLPHSGELPRDYHFRVARTTGIQLDSDGVREQQLIKAIQDLGDELKMEGRFDLYKKLSRMWWGKGYAAEVRLLHSFNSKDFPENEKNIRLDLTRNNYVRMSAQATQLTDDWNKIQQTVVSNGSEAAMRDPNLKDVLKRFTVLAGQGSRPGLGYFYSPNEERPHESKTPITGAFGRDLNLSDVMSIWGNPEEVDAAGISLGDILLQGYLPYKLYSRVQTLVNENFDAIMTKEDAFDLIRYYNHHDFRIGIGLQYLVHLSKALGVTSRIEPVLSFPLGTNDVSVSEVAKIYQTFLAGKAYKFYNEGSNNQVSFIKKIEDRNGKLLYESKPNIIQVADNFYSESMQEILQKVVTHGTGKRAKTELYISNIEQTTSAPKDKDAKNIRVPAFGKTGTTNDFTNSYFAGFIPYPKIPNQKLNLDNSYVIAAYVGYDDNQKMVRGREKIYGGKGALPLWTDFGKEILEIQNYRSFVDFSQPQFNPDVIRNNDWLVTKGNDTIPIRVDLPRGSILNQSVGAEGEKFEASNLAKTGESFVNEYAITSNVQSVVFIPKAPGNRELGRMIKPVSLELLKQGSMGTDQGPSQPIANAQAAPGGEHPKTQANEAASQDISDPSEKTVPAGGHPQTAPEEIGGDIQDDIW